MWMDTGKMTHCLTKKRKQTLSLFIKSGDNDTFSLRKEQETHRKLRRGNYVCLSLILLTCSKVADESATKYSMRWATYHEKCLSDGTTACEDIGQEDKKGLKAIDKST